MSKRTLVLHNRHLPPGYEAARPIRHVTSFSHVRRLTRAGEIKATLPLGDLEARQLVPLAEIEAQFGNVPMSVNGFNVAGFVEERVIGASGGGVTQLSFAGGDLLAELAQRIVLNLDIEEMGWRPAARVEHLDVGEESTDMPGARDGNPGTNESHNFSAGDFLYVATEFQTGAIEFTVSGAFPGETSMIIQGFDSSTQAWEDLDVVSDTTQVSGISLAQSGQLTFNTTASFPAPVRHADRTLYWIRFGFANIHQLSLAEVAGWIPVETTDAIDPIMAFAPPGWGISTAAHDTTSTAIRIPASELNGMTVLEALIRVAEMTGDQFRLAINGDREIEWLRQDVESSGVELVGGGNVLALEEARDYRRYVNRVYVFGGTGSGGGRQLTLAESTDAVPSYMFVNRAESLLELRDEYLDGAPRIERMLEFRDIVAAGPIEAEDTRRSASNRLLAAAVKELNVLIAALDYRAYSLQLIGVEQSIFPGQTVFLDYRETAAREDPYGLVQGREIVWDVRGDFLVLESQVSLSPDGVRTTGLLVATQDRWPEREADLLARAYRAAILGDGSRGGPFDIDPLLQSGAATAGVTTAAGGKPSLSSSPTAAQIASVLERLGLVNLAGSGL